MDLIYDTVFKAWAWVPWVLGLGTVGWIALALLAPGLLNVFSPLLKGASELLVEGLRALIEGVTDILDSWKTIATVIFLMWLFGNYMTWSKPEPKPVAKPAISKSAPVVKPTQEPAFRWPWEWVN